MVASRTCEPLPDLPRPRLTIDAFSQERGTLSSPDETVAGLRARAAEAARLQAELVSAREDPAPAAPRPGSVSVGAAQGVVAAVEQLRGGWAQPAVRRDAVAELRFVCRQNLRHVEKAHQSAAGEAGVLELLCRLLCGGSGDRPEEPEPEVVEEERVEVTWLLAQLCFKHTPNCERLLDDGGGCAGGVAAAVRQVEALPGGAGAAGGGQGRFGLVLRETNVSGLRAASLALLCNLAAHASEGQGLRIVEAGGGAAAVAVLRALHATGAMQSHHAAEAHVSERLADRRSAAGGTRAGSGRAERRDARAGRVGAPREATVVTAYDGPELELGVALKAALLLENLVRSQRPPACPAARNTDLTGGAGPAGDS